MKEVLINNDAQVNTGKTLYDNDGKPVQGIDRIESYTLNAQGQKLIIEYNNDADNKVDSTTYRVLDANGNIIASYTNNDNSHSTGKTLTVNIEGKPVELKGIDSFETYEYNANGHQIQINRNLNARDASDGEDKDDKGFEEVIYIERDEYGREKGRYTDLDNDKDTGTGNSNQDKAIALRDGRVLKGIDRYETYEHDEDTGHHIQTNKNLDAKGVFEEVEYRDVDSVSGQLKGIYYNRDNDMKDGVPLPEKTGETITLENGRRFEGIDNYTTYERDAQNRVITERFNLDAKGADDRVYYYDLDANGNRIGEYQNLDNDTTLTPEGKAQITGTTHILEDGRTVQGVERYYEQKFDGNNRIYERTSNLDGKDHAESVSYYVRDALGREVARYDNTNNDVLSNGNPNPTGHSHTIMLNGKEVTVNGIDRIVETKHNEYGNATQTRTNNTGELGDDKFTNVTTSEYNERHQKVADESMVNGQKSAANAYTYDIYGRQATRTVDTDFSKEGFERVETYSYNPYGHHIRTDAKQIDDPKAGTLTTTIDTDIFGRQAITREFQADGSLVVKNVNSYDIYENRIKTEKYSSEAQRSSVFSETFDQYGRPITGWEDRNGNFSLDNGDLKYILTYTDDSRNLIIRRQNTTIVGKNEIFQDYHYFYNERDLVSGDFIDINNNQKADDNEIVTYFSYIGDSNFLDKFEYSYGLDKSKIFAEWKFVYPDAGVGGEHIAGIRTEVEPAQSYITYGVHGIHFSTKDDYTTGNWAKLLDAYKGKIHVVNLTNENGSTEITIDKDVITKLAPNREFTIFGDNSDTVNLKGSSNFSQAGIVQHHAQDVYKYTTEVDGQTYTLFIDTDVNINAL